VTESVATQIANETLEIATLPEITLKIIQVVQDPRSTAHDLHQIVCNDPVLSSRVLRVVNSAFYGLPGQIGNIDRAIMLLGLNAVKNIAIAASIAKMFKTAVACDDFTGKDLWLHSIAVGAANKLITSAIGLALPDEAFLAGLIHDIGLVALMQTQGRKFTEILQRVKAGVPFRQAEQAVLATDHPAVGMALAARWKFPRSFQYVIGYHHQPADLAPENRLLAVVTHLADVLAARLRLGQTLTVEHKNVDPALISEIRLTPEAVQDITDRIPPELDVVRDMIE